MFAAKDRSDHELQFDIRAKVVAQKSWSEWVAADDKSKAAGSRFPISPRLWRAGFIYEYRINVRKRPGTERFEGFWFTRGKGVPPSPEGRAGR